MDIDPSASRAGQYLTFRLARQDCAIEAGCVRGILPWSDLTVREHPGSAGSTFLVGFATLRGQIVPVIDLGRKLGFAPASHGRTPCLIVVRTGTSLGPQTAGFVADVVSEVVDVRARDIRRGQIHARGRPRKVIDAQVVLAPEVLV